MKILKFIFLVLFFIFALIAFLPKTNLFYFAETQLAKKEIYISNEKIVDKFYKLEVKDANVIYEDILIGNFKQLDVMAMLFYNKITVKKAQIFSSNFKFIPKELESLELVYSILSPKIIDIKSKSSIGDLKGNFDLVTQKLSLELHVNKKEKVRYKEILKYFKKQKGGKYIYEEKLKLY